MTAPVVLCILDGWGLREARDGNAVAQARTPAYDAIMAGCPNATLTTFGPDVGLPDGQMGNSEVGHTNIGAGRVVEMDLRRIEGVIARGALADQPAIRRFVSALKTSGGAGHLCGVLSDGGVHSHIDHLIAVANVVQAEGIPVWLHLFADGRDVAPRSALAYLDQLSRHLGPMVRIATLTGRYFAMDRDNRWERVETAYAALVRAEGETAQTPADVVQMAYTQDISDEFIPATVLDGYTGMADGDGLMFLNFRADRARQILSAMGDPDFDGFDTGPRPKFATMSGFTEYSKRHSSYMDVVFPEEDIHNTLGAWVASKGLRQFRIAETEKYPHVTFFLNGGVETPAAGEDRYLAPSPKVATYDLQPEMSAPEVTTHLVAAIRSGDYALIVVNFANPDMVGHTGDLVAAIKAVEATDAGLGAAAQAVRDVGGAMIMCADHGNCETMIDPETGGAHTAHTTNPVPVALINGPEGATLVPGRLADLAPTVLSLMGLDQPPEMTGTSLIRV